jgi:hypothetical protein
MAAFSFISHEKFPDDQYTKEIVYLLFEGKYRIAYVRKKMQNGGLFWDVMSLGVTKHGKKHYYKSFMQDSNFLSEDIKNYLEKRTWEKAGQTTQPVKQAEQPSYLDHAPNYDQQEMPF